MNDAIQNILGILRTGRVQELLFPVGIAASVLVLICPLDPHFVDVLLSINIALSVVILLTTIFVNKPLDFNIFPSILLAITLFRLVLSVATTRLILANAGELGMQAAGSVIQSFSEFVAGESIVIGLIIFTIIVVIQFIVITKGATRVSEVAARFTLDAMPGRQMAIDADLNAGIIDEREAQRRRMEITEQADFFGAMDGASKFVRGDAIASIVITLVNIIGGLVIGMIEHGMPLVTALSLYTRLTIGDGLVNQVPAFLISVATGMLVTRSSQGSNLPAQVITQMLARPVVLIMSGMFLSLLTLTSLPKLPLLSISVCCFGMAYLGTKAKGKVKAKEIARQVEEEKAAQAKPEERIEDYLTIDPMELEIGVGLIPLADPGKGGDLLDRVHRIRQNIASEIGILLPRVRIRDSFQLDQIQYRIKIANMPVAVGVIQPDMYLAMDGGNVVSPVQGIETIDPAFGTPALWIDESTKDHAELYGYTVVEPGAVIATHLTEVIRKHADELLTRDATQHLLDELKTNTPAVVDELVPNVLKLAQVQQILQLLLKEQVPIRQLGTILETLGDYGHRTKDPILLGEYVRQRLGRTISSRYRDSEGTLNVVMFDPGLEDQIRGGFEWTEQGIYIRISPHAIDHLCNRIVQEVEKLNQLNLPLVVLVNPQIRPVLRQMTASRIPQLVVLCYNEITQDTRINSIGMVTL
ncbi:MAG TPA: flagellar biosynthesis protein FlhA [Planctomycetaceae bacterium]|nr:flagellar biosynthesis protein FlhA [Planctomycetaceae bacterium]